MYQVRFILFYVLEARGANMSQNSHIWIQNRAGLILHPPRTLATSETINTACYLPEAQIFGEFYATGGRNQGAKGGDGLSVTTDCPDTLFGKDYSNSASKSSVFSPDRKIHT